MNMNSNTNDRSVSLSYVCLLAMIASFAFLAALTFAESPPGGTWQTASRHPAEDKIDALLGEPKFEMQQLFKGERFPNVAVAVDGTVLATWGSSSVRVRRSEDGGKTWGEEITIAKRGFQGGGLTVDEKSGNILAFVEAHHPPAPITIYHSTDYGKTWKSQKTVINKDSKGNVPSMHMNEHGITLRYGKHRGRLLRPSRWYAGKNERARWPQHYTNAIYSDDGGKTWHTSDPFPALGTGEATIAELSDGRIYYNSRRHWAPEGANPRRRWTAWSEDGGATWKDLSICSVLPDGPQDSNYGCMGGLVRLPVRNRDILIYSNCDSPSGRHHGTVWASFDGGKTWPIKRLVYKGSFAYSSLTVGRPGTPSKGWIYLHFEGGPKGGSTLARFNLSWVLQGEPTGDGSIPDGFKVLTGTDLHNSKSKPIPFFDIREEEVRVGTMAVSVDGSALLFKDNQEKRIILVKRSEDGGKTWGAEIEVGKMVKIEGDMSDDGRYRGPSVGWGDLGNVVVDENTGDIMVFASSLKPAQILYRSRDHGKTWKRESIVIKQDKNGWLSSTVCSCDPGVTLRYGEKKGRLLMPTRVFVGYLNKGQNRKFFDKHYSNALYSDDGGKTWIPSAPFPLGGTGEAGLAELSDGRIYYNSRTHCRGGNRRIAWSYDYGETWQHEHEDDELFDGPPDVYGCKAALLRLPYDDRDVLLFSSPGRRDIREDITVWVSFDGGETWPVNRLVRKGPGNYTWLAAGRNGTPSEGMIYLLAGKDWLARFNLAWIMENQQLPEENKAQ